VDAVYFSTWTPIVIMSFVILTGNFDVFALFCNLFRLVRSSFLSFNRRNLMASPNIIDLKVDGGWCDEPWMNLRPIDVGLAKSFVTKPKTLSAAMQWLTSKNSTESLPSLVQICRKVSSKPLFLLYQELIWYQYLSILNLWSKQCHPWIYETVQFVLKFFLENSLYNSSYSNICWKIFQQAETCKQLFAVCYVTNSTCWPS